MARSWLYAKLKSDRQRALAGFSLALGSFCLGYTSIFLLFRYEEYEVTGLGLVGLCLFWLAVLATAVIAWWLSYKSLKSGGFVNISLAVIGLIVSSLELSWVLSILLHTLVFGLLSWFGLLPG